MKPKRRNSKPPVKSSREQDAIIEKVIKLEKLVWKVAPGKGCKCLPGTRARRRRYDLSIVPDQRGFGRSDRPEGN
jgi:hypothetical protein